MSDLFTFRLKKLYLVLFVMLSTVGCDQASKAIARDSISLTGPISYFSSMIVLEHAENKGVFLSLGARLPQQIRSFLFIGLVSVFLILLSLYLFKNKTDFLTTTALSLVLAGGIGNLIERILKGSVTDFVLLKTTYASTGIFNVADVAIVLGAFVLFVLSINQDSKFFKL